METKSYFIARARCYEVKAADGSVITAEDVEVTLAMDDGYPVCTRGKCGTYGFNTIAEAYEKWTKWDGMPWYFRLKPDSLRVYKVTERKCYERTEEEVAAE